MTSQARHGQQARPSVLDLLVSFAVAVMLAAPAQRVAAESPTPQPPAPASTLTSQPLAPISTPTSQPPAPTSVPTSQSPAPPVVPEVGRPAAVPSPLDQTENILILGTDQRGEGGSWRTDTIMVVAIDHAGRRVGIISIPRDLWVEIPGYGRSRINQADYLGEARKYPGGGPALTGRLIKETLGIPTQHWVRLKYDGLPRLVDTLGGVMVHLDCPLYERTPDPVIPWRYVDWSLPAGDVALDGATAKKFATYRYLTNDSGRARRQQQLIWAMRERALQLDMLPKIPELWQALSDVFSTDLNLLDILRLAGLGASLQPGELHSLVVGMEVMANYITPSGAWVLVIRDRLKLESELANLFAGRSLADLAHNQAQNGKCPPVPRNFTAPQPTPTPAAAPATPAAPG